MRTVLDLLVRNLPDLVVLGIVCLIQLLGARWVLRGPARSSSRWVRWGVVGLTLCSFAAIGLALAMRFARFAKYFPSFWLSWGRSFFVVWSLLSVWAFIAVLVSKLLPKPRPQAGASRRRFLKTAQAALFAGPAAVVGYGTFIERTTVRLREQTIPVRGLAPDLEGLRIAQISDIHMSPFLTAREVERVVALANETKAHLALVTGDLITGPGDPLDSCLNLLSHVRADAGVYGCLGNHEVYAKCEEYVTRRGGELGMRFLRHEAAVLQFGNSAINIAGVDYQPKATRYLVGTERLIQPGILNMLLSHNPDVFPVAANKGFDVTIAGHTHGGQIRFEILHDDLNIARFYTPYVDGLYTRGNSSVFVTRGIGTIVLPMRLGAPPEVALLRLAADKGVAAKNGRAAG